MSESRRHETLAKHTKRKSTILVILWGKGGTPPSGSAGPEASICKKSAATRRVVEGGYRCAEVYAHAMVASGRLVERPVKTMAFEARDATRDLPTTARAVRTPGEPAKPARGRATHRARAHR